MSRTGALRASHGTRAAYDHALNDVAHRAPRRHRARPEKPRERRALKWKRAFAIALVVGAALLFVVLPLTAEVLGS